ncbi:MAG TPA: hypothetical protein VMF60_01510 [Acidimicrobiales bacterium]|nr:hypothetical protein [Acidimicrobiales bacterium]
MTHEHLSDEELSARLDGHEPPTTGAARPEPETELARCEDCRARLAALERARDLVRRPVAPVVPSVREAALSAALAGDVGGDGDAARRARESSVASLDARRGRRAVGNGRARLWLGAAAAVAAVVSVGAVVALSRSRTESPASSAAASSASTSTSRAAPSPQALSRRSSAPGAPAHAGASGTVDLGSVSSLSQLRSRLAPVLAAPDSASSPSAPRADQNSAGKATQGVFSTAALPEDVDACEAKAEASVTSRRAGAAKAALVEVATATYRGTPALVVVVQPATTSSTASAPPPVAVVLARRGCGVLGRTTL